MPGSGKAGLRFHNFSGRFGSGRLLLILFIFFGAESNVLRKAVVDVVHDSGSRYSFSGMAEIACYSFEIKKSNAPTTS